MSGNKLKGRIIGQMIILQYPLLQYPSLLLFDNYFIVSMQPAKTIDQGVYTMLCHHETDNGGVKFVLAECGRDENIQHKISQWGDTFICTYCAQMIQKACNYIQNETSVCHHCDGNLEEFIVSKEICEHEEQTISEVKLICIDSRKEEPFTHTLELGDKKICKACERKLTYKYQDQDSCKICANKTKELLNNLKGSLANEELRIIKRFLALLAERKSLDEVKAELESHCVSREANQEHRGCCKIKDLNSFIQQYEQLNHKDNKVEFYTKCGNHRDIPISVCSTCVAVLLNINACPFGCDSKLANTVKVTKGKVTYSTGFIIFSPLSDPKHIHDHTLAMAVVQNIAVSKKLDQTEVSSKNLTPGDKNQIKSEEYPVYGSIAKVSNQKYVVTGGLVTKSPNKSEITANSWLFTIIDQEGVIKFEATKLPDFSTPRCSHGSIVVNNELYIVGGFDGKQYLTSCEKFSFDENKWVPAPNLNFPRAKITIFPRQRDSKTEIVVLGGLSQFAEVYDYGQVLAPEGKQWQKTGLQTNSFGTYPFVTGRAASSNNPQLAKYSNILLFGGSNLQEYSINIDEFVTHPQKFVQFKESGLNLQTKRSFCELGYLQTSDKTKKKIVLFGGNLQHESILNIELVSVQIKNQTILTPVYSDVIGSRLLFSQLMFAEWQKHYKGIAQELSSSGRINESQAKTADKPANRQFLDTVWITGRAVANYIMKLEK